jgi:hypothetical protein
LKIEEFWQMTWRDFSIYVIAWERNNLLNVSMTREIVYSVYNSQPRDKGSKMPAKENLWPLPIDEKVEVRPPTQAEIERMMNLLTAPQKA